MKTVEIKTLPLSARDRIRISNIAIAEHHVPPYTVTNSVGSAVVDCGLMTILVYDWYHLKRATQLLRLGIRPIHGAN